MFNELLPFSLGNRRDKKDPVGTIKQREVPTSAQYYSHAANFFANFSFRQNFPANM